MKQQKHHMGVEVPSFFEYQRRKAEAEAAAASAKAKKQGFFDALFAPEARPKAEQPPAPPGPSTARPGFMNRPAYLIDANQWFEVAKIWSRMTDLILTHGNRPFLESLTPPIYNATRAEREFQAAANIAQLFGIPGSEFQGMTIEQSWQNVIGPFFEGIERSINRAKPSNILGSISFELEPTTGELIMAYRPA